MVLLVEDEVSIAGLVRQLLTVEGIEVRTAANGRQALAALADKPARLILLDMRMPVMNGWEFAAAYRESPPPHAPIVVMSAGRDVARKAADVAAAAFIAKPFDLDELVRLVKRYL